MFTLIIENRAGEIVDEHSFDEGEFIVGRSQHCDIILASPNVSRRHVRLFVEHGMAYLEDLNSANGAIVEGVRIHGVVELGHSSQIRVGDYIIHLESTPFQKSTNERLYGSLTLLTANGPGREFSLQRPSILIGRGRDAAITILDPSISRIHAKITADNTGLVFVEDLQSANGTFVNDEPVLKSELVSGDILRLGNQDLLFEANQFKRPGSSPQIMQQKGHAFQKAWTEILQDPKKLSLVAAVVAACTVAGLLAATLGRQDEAPTPIVAPEPVATPKPVEEKAPDNSAEELRKCIRDSREAFRQKNLTDFDLAVQRCEEIDPVNSTVVSLKNRLILEKRWYDRLESARSAVKEGRPGTAMTLLKGISQDSKYYPDADDLRSKVRESVEILDANFLRKCPKTRKPKVDCAPMLLELLKVRPLDSKLLKLQKRWDL